MTDREGLRWRQSASWCSRGVVSHLSRMFQNLRFINLYIDWFVSSRRETNGIEEGENVTAQTLASTPADCFPGTTTWWSTRQRSKGNTGLWRRNKALRHLREIKLLLCIYMGYGAWVKHVNCFSSNHENIRGMEVQFPNFKLMRHKWCVLSFIH